MNTRYFLTIVTLVLSIQFCFAMPAHAQAPTIQAKYTLTHKKRITRTVSEYTFKASLINGDEPIKLASATARSNSFYTTVIDADVSFDDMAAGETIQSSDTFTIHHDRREVFGPESLSWNVSFEATAPQGTEIGGRVEIIVNEIEMREGDSEGLGISYGFSRKGTYYKGANADTKVPFTLRVHQSTEPAEGLVLSKDINGTEFHSADKGSIHEETTQGIKAITPGDYIITTTVTVVETGQTFDEITQIKVYAEEDPFISVSLGMFGIRNLPVGVAVSIPVEVELGSEDKDLVTAVELVQLESGETIQLSVSNTKTIHGHGFTKTHKTDTYYKGTVELDTSEADRCFSYSANAISSKGVVPSIHQERFCVTDFPIGYVHPEHDNLWEALVANVFYANNLLLLEIEIGTSGSRIREIAASVNASVAGISEVENIYQIKLLSPPSVLEGLENVARTLQVHPEVISIQVYAKGPAFSSIADDPLFQNGLQPHLEQIGAVDSWYVMGDAAW